MLKSPINPNFNKDAINELNKIKINVTTNKQIKKSPKKNNYQDSPNSKEEGNYIQNLNIEFIEKLNKNGKKDENEVLNKMSKFRDYMKKQKEYLENTKNYNEIINNIQSDQKQETNLRLNLAENIKHSDKKPKGKGIALNMKL